MVNEKMNSLGSLRNEGLKQVSTGMEIGRKIFKMVAKLNCIPCSPTTFEGNK